MAACHAADDNEGLLDAATDGPVVVDAPPDDAPAADLLVTRAYLALDAVHELSLLEARIDSYLVDGAWTAYVAAFNPGQTCCWANGDFVCPANPAAWDQAPWTIYDFSIEGEHGAVYSLNATSTSVRLTARIDLDCDGSYADITLACDRVADATDCTMIYPPALE